MTNIVQFKDLEKCGLVGQKSPILVLQDESNINGSLLVEELAELLKPHNNPVEGSSIWLQYSGNTGTIKCLDLFASYAIPTTNIIHYTHSEQAFHFLPLTQYAQVNFTNQVDKTCNIFNVYQDYKKDNNGNPIAANNQVLNIFNKDDFNRIVWENEYEYRRIDSINTVDGTITKIDVSGCPGLQTIYFNGANNINANILDIRKMYKANIINLANNNNIKFLVGYSYINKRYFVISNFTHGRLIMVPTVNVKIQINPFSYPNETPFFWANYLGEDFTQDEKDLAASKNIRLINVR